MEKNLLTRKYLNGLNIKKMALPKNAMNSANSLLKKEKL